MSKKNAKGLPFWVTSAINFVLPFVTSAVMRLLKDDSLGEKLAEIFLGRVDDVIGVLSDDNPENGKQIGTVLRRTVNADLLPVLVEESQEKLQQVKSDDLREFLVSVRNGGAAILQLTTDEDPDNSAQLEAYAAKLKKELFEFFKEAGEIKPEAQANGTLLTIARTPIS